MTGTSDPRLFRASALVAAPTTAWPPPGAVVELAGGGNGASTSLAVAVVARTQGTGGIAAWVQPRHGLLFPPDLAQNGVALDALVVVHVPVRDQQTPRASSHGVPAAAELLLRSGSFDLLVLDLRPAAPPRGAWLARLQALAREHGSRVLVLTDARTPTTGVGLAQRIATRRRREGDAFVVEPSVLRDKLHTANPGSDPGSHPGSGDPSLLLRRRGPAGLQ